METTQGGNVVFCPDDEVERLNEENEVEYKLPPFPVPMRPWGEGDWRYTGDQEDYKKRIHEKLFKFWILWGRLRTNTELEELLARYEADKQGDAYVAKNCIVDILCEWSKILADTNIVDELAWLHLSEEEFKARKDKDTSCGKTNTTSSVGGSDP